MYSSHWQRTRESPCNLVVIWFYSKCLFVLGLGSSDIVFLHKRALVDSWTRVLSYSSCSLVFVILWFLFYLTRSWNWLTWTLFSFFCSIELVLLPRDSRFASWCVLDLLLYFSKRKKSVVRAVLKSRRKIVIVSRKARFSKRLNILVQLSHPGGWY